MLNYWCRLFIEIRPKCDILAHIERQYGAFNLPTSSSLQGLKVIEMAVFVDDLNTVKMCTGDNEEIAGG